MHEQADADVSLFDDEERGHLGNLARAEERAKSCKEPVIRRLR